MDGQLYWFIVAYMGGCIVSMIVIEIINTIEYRTGGWKFIPDNRALLSWLWFAFCVWMFLKTLLTRK